ncbi:MAG: hypothetical protein ACM3NR_00440 [Methanosarcina sp.]
MTGATYGQPVTERVYLHTDRESYVAGDHLLYSLYRKGDPEQNSKYAYLILRNQYSVVTSVRLEFEGNSAFGCLHLPDTLQSAVYQLAAFTNAQRNVPESFFMKEIVISNRFDNELKNFSEKPDHEAIKQFDNQDVNNHPEIHNIVVHTGKERYSLREKISISINSEQLFEEDTAIISVSVSEIIPGAPYVKTAPEILSGEILKIDMNRFFYEPELSGAILQGKVISSGNKDKVVFVSTTDTISNLQYARTDSSGTFRMLLNPYYSGRELVIRLKDNQDAVIVPDKRIDGLQPFNPSKNFIVPGIKSYMARMGKETALRKYYNQNLRFDTIHIFRSSSYIPRLYYSNFTTIVPADYIELKDFPEISTEIIPSLKVRKSKDQYIVTYPYLKYTTGTNISPAIFFNGVPVDDISQFANSGSREIRKIETVATTRYYGELIFQGILSVFTYDMNIRNISFKAPAIIYKSEMSEPYIRPVSFLPENLPKHYPDLREVLLWEPRMELKGKSLTIDCYASDIRGVYRINVQGITKKGIPLGGSAIINIDEE